MYVKFYSQFQYQVFNIVSYCANYSSTSAEAKFKELKSELKDHLKNAITNNQCRGSRMIISPEYESNSASVSMMHLNFWDPPFKFPDLSRLVELLFKLARVMV